MSFDRRRCGRETRWRERERKAGGSRKRKRKTGGRRKRKGFPLHFPGLITSNMHQYGHHLIERASALPLMFAFAYNSCSKTSSLLMVVTLSKGQAGPGPADFCWP